MGKHSLSLKWDFCILLWRPHLGQRFRPESDHVALWIPLWSGPFQLPPAWQVPSSRLIQLGLTLSLCQGLTCDKVHSFQCDIHAID